MAFLASLIVAFAFLDGPARWLVIGAGALVEIGEAMLMIRWSKRGQAHTGGEALVGRTAVAATDCRPNGQVIVDGERWAAACPQGCAPGTQVTILTVDGLALTVAPLDTRHAASR